MGYIKPSKKELSEIEVGREREHHHYHCKLNPEGFQRLKHENLLEDKNKRLKAKVKNIKSSASSINQS